MNSGLAGRRTLVLTQGVRVPKRTGSPVAEEVEPQSHRAMKRRGVSRCTGKRSLVGTQGLRGPELTGSPAAEEGEVKEMEQRDHNPIETVFDLPDLRHYHIAVGPRGMDIRDNGLRVSRRHTNGPLALSALVKSHLSRILDVLLAGNLLPTEIMVANAKLKSSLRDIINGTRRPTKNCYPRWFDRIRKAANKRLQKELSSKHTDGTRV
ncbi:hypothetical protein NDU88_000429 [Pleurodeles waltl]|uniref:Uncharacterized protein n=1 Tax=Pleurodeles waltl TaxID=8319 RepID=A0AAV7KQN5_PLEWA|nr:hypothetical protein NDU88_000429 [Pleurodeles waltl]